MATSPVLEQPETSSESGDWYEKSDSVRQRPHYKCDFRATIAKKGYTFFSSANRRAARPRVRSWRLEKKHGYPQMLSRLLNEIVPREVAVPVEERFHQLADEWSREVRTISSVKDLTSHPDYQKIIALGWDVVPFLLTDLTQKHRFWFPALSAITGIRPFDPSEAGNSKRMTEAWIAWGKRKKLI